MLIAILCISLFAGKLIRMSGNAMSPNIRKDDVLYFRKARTYEQGDIIAFAYEGKTVIRRLIAVGGDWVDFDDAGNVYVNDTVLNEPYLNQKDPGDHDIQLPFQVPEGSVFVLADARDIGIDSRMEAFGCVSASEIKGKVVFRLFPWRKMGKVR